MARRGSAEEADDWYDSLSGTDAGLDYLNPGWRTRQPPKDLHAMNTYTDSHGVKHQIADMPYAYLKNAHAKLTREADAAGHDAVRRYLEAVAMAAEIERRDRELAEHRQILESEGVFVLPGLLFGGKEGFIAHSEDGEPIPGAEDSTEAGAWARAWTALCV